MSDGAAAPFPYSHKSTAVSCILTLFHPTGKVTSYFSQFSRILNGLIMLCGLYILVQSIHQLDFIMAPVSGTKKKMSSLLEFCYRMLLATLERCLQLTDNSLFSAHHFCSVKRKIFQYREFCLSIYTIPARLMMIYSDLRVLYQQLSSFRRVR